ncbi:heavy metal sensor histidine kinase [Neopusillimonas maritima]|uniref:heavy metal sensor histidine kinase n=1 Tax=Neopusillimonas maritima TaxID=2026239 RepID=UPI001FEE2760|nr:heavy metal sensor histidine kinase [Neopusillimonas maritima]|tara:strand:+ start:121948 stop:123390 length:1443 start_codon:yes stop_codon:yes gene_type:complete
MKFWINGTPSLTLRLTISIGAGISLLLLSFGWLIERSINNHFVDQDVDELNAARKSIESTIKLVAAGESIEFLKNRFASAISGHHNAEFLVADANGTAIYATPGGNLTPLLTDVVPTRVIDDNTVSLWTSNGQTYRSAVFETISPTNQIQSPLKIALATEIDFHLHYLESFHAYLRWLTVLACLIAIVTTWFAVHQGHAPIRRISRQINAITSEQLHLRLETQGVPSELMPLAAAFNNMIDRLEDGFQRLSNFTGDIAHELRTPITNLTTQTQVALSRARTAMEYREVLYSSLEEYERMAKMVSDMLFLAQADNQLIEPEFTDIYLVNELLELADFFEAWSEARQVAIVVTGNKEITVAADRAMLRRALSNLISNAVRYTPAGNNVQAVVQTDKNGVTVSITNSGPTIPPEHLEHLFKRFYRPDPSRRRNGEGAGLGLAIVKSIVQAHGGQIKATSTNGITVFQIRFNTVDQHPYQHTAD